MSLKILLGPGHTEVLSETKGRCVNFLIIHLNENNAGFHSLPWLRRLGCRSGWLLKGNKELPELNFPGLQLKRTGLAGTSRNPLINPHARSRALGACCLGSSCHGNSLRISQIKLLNTSVALRRAFITGLVAQRITPTPPCMHTILHKCVVYTQSSHVYFSHYHKALPSFPGSVLVLAVAAFQARCLPLSSNPPGWESRSCIPCFLLKLQKQSRN